MRLKNLFTVPEGQKITEKQMYRVLVSSICGILLCMVCMVGSAWALFSNGSENTVNTVLKQQEIGDR